MLASQTSRLGRLRQLAAALLDPASPASRLRPEVLEMVEMFREAAGNRFTPEAEIASGETRTSQGLALSPTMASLCAGGEELGVFVMEISDLTENTFTQIEIDGEGNRVISENYIRIE
jgi:hypothetical protein